MNDYSSESPKPIGTRNAWNYSSTDQVPQGVDTEAHWKQFDTSVNAVSFGFVATAILISMFLVMAIFERFLRPRNSFSSGQIRGDRALESIQVQTEMQLSDKLDNSSTVSILSNLCFLFQSYIEVQMTKFQSWLKNKLSTGNLNVGDTEKLTWLRNSLELLNNNDYCRLFL